MKPPLSERVRSGEVPIVGARIAFIGDRVSRETLGFLADEIAALEAERDRLRVAITQAFLYAERGAYQRAAEILGAALEGGEE